MAVIGGGITGSLVAHRLVGEGIETVLVEKREMGTDSTAASTSLLQYEIDAELADLIDRVGVTHAVRAYQLGLEAIDQIAIMVQKIGDPCGCERKDSLYIASKRSHVAKLRREYKCRRQYGFDVEYLDHNDVMDRFGFSAPAAILSRGDAQIDIFRFTHTLLGYSQRNGVRAYDRTDVTAIERRNGRVRLKTDRGSTVDAHRIVFATGYESQQYLRSPSLVSTTWPDHRCLTSVLGTYAVKRPSSLSKRESVSSAWPVLWSSPPKMTY